MQTMWVVKRNQKCFQHIHRLQLFQQGLWLRVMKVIGTTGFSTLIEADRRGLNKWPFSNKRHTVNQSVSIAYNRLLKKDMICTILCILQLAHKLTSSKTLESKHLLWWLSKRIRDQAISTWYKACMLIRDFRKEGIIKLQNRQTVWVLPKPTKL